jgi:hypothetical protein
MRTRRRFIEAVGERYRRALPFALHGLDCDNDKAFMNEAIFDFCKAAGIELTCLRAYKENGQAWVEQKWINLAPPHAFKCITKSANIVYAMCPSSLIVMLTRKQVKNDISLLNSAYI